jgi:hypothetical protein
MIMRKPSQTRIALKAAALAALLAAAPAAAFADAGQVGVNAAIRNAVQEKGASQAGFHPAVVRDAVHLGDQVISGQDSRLQVLLLDRSVFTLGANARMTIDRFVYDPNRRASDVAVSVAKGSFRFMSGPTLAGQGHNAINTPVAAIGVRGTIVEGVVGSEVADVLAGQSGLPAFSGDPAGATLVILRGPGLDNEGLDRTGAIDVTAHGATVTLDRPGQAVLVWPGQGPVVFWLSDIASGRLAGVLLGSPNGPGKGGVVSGSVQIASGGAPAFTPAPPPPAASTHLGIPPFSTGPAGGSGACVNGQGVFC